MRHFKSNLTFIGLIASIFFSTFSLAQNGTIRGTLTDKNSGEPMMFANVLVVSTDIGETTDFEGNYSLSVPSGTYDLEFSFVGYTTSKITEVKVIENEVTLIDFQLDDSVLDLDVEIVVKASILQPRNEVALLTMRKKSLGIQNSISSENISKYAASNAADAVLRTTGTAVVGGKYVIVRGLGDRYTNAQLNGLPLPSTDPYRNSVQLDLIPANLLDNIVLSKTFIPDMPADFAGGSVNINTKTYPSQFTLQAGVSLTYNTQSSLNDEFLTHEGGDRDWLGYDDGSRRLDLALTDEKLLDLLRGSSYLTARRTDSVDYRNNLDSSAKLFNSQLEGTNSASSLNHSVSLSVGNQFELFGNPLGISVGANYRRSFDNYTGAANNYYEIRGDNLAPFYEFKDNVAVDNPIVSGLATVGYKLGKQTAINFNALYNHDGEKTTRYLEGTVTEFSGIFRSRVLQWRERTLQDYQANFEHTFGTSGIKLEIKGQLVSMQQDEPDLRLTGDQLLTAADGTQTVQFNAAEFDLPSHIWRKLEDQQQDFKADLTIPDIFEVPAGGNALKLSTLKFGGLISRKQRNFSEFSYILNDRSPDSPDYEGSLNDYAASQNLGDLGLNEAGTRHLIGLYWEDLETASLKNTYTGEKNITAAYAMGVLEYGKFKLIGGVRAENTELGAVSKIDLLQAQMINPDTTLSNNTDTLQFFPSINFVYGINDKMNLRASYSKTIARGNMREIAPFAAVDYAGGFLLSGNPELLLTNITNYDIRWEYFPTPSELISGSVFYKDFVNPIGTSFVIIANNPEIRYENLGYSQTVDSLGNTITTNGKATVLGMELEFRKNLGSLTPTLNNFSISSNLTLQTSEQAIPDDEKMVIEQQNPDKGTTRKFFGQSDFLFNGALNYQNNEAGFDALLSVNYFSERIVRLSRGADPDVVEQPRFQLDLSLSQQLNERFSVRLVGKNLLNQNVRQTVEFDNQTYDIIKFKRGVEFMFAINYRI